MKAEAAPPQRLFRKIIVLAVLVLLFAGGWLLYQSPLLKVSQVRVVGAENLDPAAIAAASGLLGQNILLADLREVEAKLSRIPMVRSVKVERTWPGRMVIRVQERQPWGYWQVEDDLYVVDDQGYVLDNARPSEDAPVIVQLDSERRWLPGEQVDPYAISLAQQLIESAPRSLGLAVEGLEYNDSSGLTAVFEGGLRATFGDSRDLDYKVTVLFVLLEKAREDGRKIHNVDLRFGDSVAFR